MTAKEFYTQLGIKRSTYFKYKDMGMPTDDLDAAKSCLVDRMAYLKEHLWRLEYREIFLGGKKK